MKTVSHLEKIARLQALRQRLDPLQDFALWFWAGMTAGTQAVNAALHQANVTLDDDVFPAQPGVYLVGQADGSLKPCLHPLGDVLHVGRPKVEGPVPPDVAEMMEEMETIEHYRDPCLREGLAPTADIVRICVTALTHCLALLDSRMQKASHGH